MNAFGAIPDTLTVGAHDDVSDHTSLATVPYLKLVNNSTGEIRYTGHNVNTTTTISGGISALMRMVDISATGQADQVPGAFAAQVVDNLRGTSVAAPQVAGAAGVLKDWAYDTGSLSTDYRTDPYVLRTMISAMGDGGASDTMGGGANEATTGLDRGIGFGHLRFTLPFFLGDSAYAHSHVYRFPDAAEGDIIEWPVGLGAGAEPSQIQGWKFAAHMDHDWYDSSPAMQFSLIDKCPAGGGAVVVRTAVRFAHKGRIRMSAGDMATQYRGRCLWMRAWVTKADAPFGLYVMDYAYTNARVNHDM